MQNQRQAPAELPEIIVGDVDHQNLTAFAEKLDGPLSDAGEALLSELDRATVVRQHELPEDTVRMNSVVSFESSDGSLRTYKLVYPDQANIDDNRVSVLTPIGRALIGLRVNETFPWAGRDGHEHVLTIKSIRQDG